MKTPFKLLDAYTLKDKGEFWGRDEEVAALYDMATKNRLLLVYGQSGTGKTSLIQCGLAGRFDVTDWRPVFIRRGEDIARAIDRELSRVAGADAGSTPAETIDNIYMAGLRPVYLIFDQLEEVFILGSEAEQDKFAQTLRAILDSGTPCRIVLIIREEYVARLYDLERMLPTLFDRRLRVEPMSNKKVTQVLDGSFKRYNIEASAPQQTLYQQIIDNVSGEKAGIPLPYLQVYLDMLYQKAFAKTYPNQQVNGEWLPLSISADTVRETGKIDNALDQFLQEQVQRIQTQLRRQYPNADSDAVRKVLDAFVTEEGTKRPIQYQQKGETLVVDSRLQALFQPVTPEQTAYCCQQLEQARLLRMDNEHIELAHDALAALIDQKRSTTQRRLSEQLARLLHNYREYQDTGQYLTRVQFNSLQDLRPLLEQRIEPAVRNFLKDSEKHIEVLEQAQLLAERRKRQRITIVAIAATAALCLMAWQYVALRQTQQERDRKTAQSLRNAAQTLKVEGRYTEALGQLRAVQPFAGNLPAAQRDSLILLDQAWSLVRDNIRAGDSLRKAEYLTAALTRYEQAFAASPDTTLQRLVAQTRQDRNALLDQALREGMTMGTINRPAEARRAFERALRIQPENAEAKRRLGL
jgi:hypothetical protein